MISVTFGGFLEVLHTLDCKSLKSLKKTIYVTLKDVTVIVSFYHLKKSESVV